MAYKEELYTKWINGSITEKELKQLKSSGDLEAIESIMEKSARLTLPDYNKQSAFEALTKANNSKAKRKQKSFSFRPLLAIAASIVLLVGAWYLIRDTSTIVSSPYGETLAYSLPDNSRVTLNDGTSIRYQASTWSSKRSLDLKGEALFEVEKGSTFTIETQWGTVEVIGTKFNVKAWDEVFRIECYEGKVLVTDLSTDKEQMLVANQAVDVKMGGINAVESIHYRNPLWTAGTSRFVSEPMSSVFNEIERQFDIIVVNKNQNKIFTGIFQHTNIKQALDQVCLPMSLTYEISQDGKTVTIGQ